MYRCTVHLLSVSTVPLYQAIKFCVWPQVNSKGWRWVPPHRRSTRTWNCAAIQIMRSAVKKIRPAATSGLRLDLLTSTTGLFGTPSTLHDAAQNATPGAPQRQISDVFHSKDVDPEADVDDCVLEDPQSTWRDGSLLCPDVQPHSPQHLPDQEGLSDVGRGGQVHATVAKNCPIAAGA